ncbi:transposase IS116/IS110/IS902 family protein [Nitrospirillum amazonense]|uniref:Transposase IS116/IS110/IS902 family protein n=1 Tax=Nitrospirillum amazonense TaxID=28077 RepID=A0A560EHC4_9PROT|nr:transposase [Nitrospirillum amazonense]TWB08798.1 transposase IS116/IS110/IS902 family protein [Nitrospirillum amazonense]
MSHADLFSKVGREWLARQPLPDDERAAIDRHVRELDRLDEDLEALDREIAQGALDDPAIRRLITITGVNLAVASGLAAAIGDIRRFASPQKLVSYFGLHPRVRQSGLGAAHHGRISKVGRSHARAMLVEAAWAVAKAPGNAGHLPDMDALRRRFSPPLATLPEVVVKLAPVSAYDALLTGGAA